MNLLDLTVCPRRRLHGSYGVLLLSYPLLKLVQVCRIEILGPVDIFLQRRRVFGIESDVGLPRVLILGYNVELDLELQSCH